MKYYHKRLAEYIDLVIEDIINHYDIRISKVKKMCIIRQLYKVYGIVPPKYPHVNLKAFRKAAIQACKLSDNAILSSFDFIELHEGKYLYLKFSMYYCRAKYYFPEGPNRGTYSYDLINYTKL